MVGFVYIWREDTPIPSDFMIGRRIVGPTAGKIWITDGQKDSLLLKGLSLPSGSVVGRSKATNSKISASNKGRIPWNKGIICALQKEMAEW